MLLISRVFFDVQLPDEGLRLLHFLPSLQVSFLIYLSFCNMINEVDALLGDFYWDRCRDL